LDIRDVLIDGTDQLHQWLDEALDSLTAEQVNLLPAGKCVSIGFNAWHVTRTSDNIVNFVFKKATPIWLERGYMERLGLPKVEQGTGMPLENAQALQISDPAALREYGQEVGRAVRDFLKNVSVAELEEPQMIKPLGEMPKWRVCRQVLMTHGFMHLGEINAVRGQLGMQFSI
jgi:hypothetical protein